MLWLTLQKLKSKDASVRLKAVEKLADDDAFKAIEPLIGAFSDPDEAVRKAAAKAIGESRDEQCLPPLLRALHDKNELTREGAADALRQLNNRDAVPELVPLLSDAAPNVRWHAARALEALGWTPDNQASAARFTVARARIEEASAYGFEAVDALTLVLKTGAYHQRREAVASLCQIPDARVVKALILALKDADDQVRSAAVESLATLAEPSSVPDLILALGDFNKHVRAVAAEALGQFGGAKAFEPLLRRTRDKDWEVREAICLALGKMKNPRGFEPLAAALKDTDREVREAAVRGLGLLGDRRAIGPLLGVVVDEHDSVRQPALAALSTIDMRWERSDAAHAARPLLQEALKSNQYWIRQAAADALGHIGNLKYVEPVQPAPANTGPAPVLIEAFHQRKQTTTDVLIGLLADFDHELRFAAAETLGRIGQTNALPSLNRALKDTDKTIRKAAAQAIETLRGKPTPETNLILRGEDFPL